ncbi:hypothetical protein [Leptospira sp. GIMC2001]|uniref:hypothetical protein n=1 Tax=Leptospira sp. GIMC2001 TaxID=1513297 RepID=UPI00234A1F78|nr:hypothetical protein [Leptospira sp. GIMC2001]WCL49212.1 hypothetical protein O4O04_18250 [Leptospira sp. GIMC2001]
MRALQILTDEYIDQCSKLTPIERLEWLEDYKFLIPLSAYQERIDEVVRLWEESNLKTK